jgi:hypothetical protein
VIGKSVNVAAVSGSVFVTLPNGETVPVSGALNLPSGTQVDARSGALRLTTAAARLGQTQSGVFGGAVFKVTQARAGANRGLTTLSIVEGVRGTPSYRSCRSASGRSAHAARLSSRVLQTLHSTVHGRFRTRGRYSAGTVRGTSWDTTDRCDGTLTVVHRGTVLVTDFARHRTVAVHAGHRYFAKAA